MKKAVVITGLFLFVAAFILLNRAPASASQQAYTLPVLVYHHIQENVQSDVSCTPEQFSAQIIALKNAGFTPLTLAQTRLFLAGALPEIARPVLITFDDGYESLYHFALPVAVAEKVPMTVFVITSRIGRKIQFAEYLNERQIKEMANSGYFDFGSHTHDLHNDSVTIYNAFGASAENPVLRLVQHDLRMSSARFAAIIGQRPQAIAWPYGKFNPAFSTIARQSGFRLHFTSASGYNEPGANPFAIKRIPVTARDTPESVLKKASGGQR